MKNKTNPDIDKKVLVKLSPDDEWSTGRFIGDGYWEIWSVRATEWIGLDEGDDPYEWTDAP
jgi:hypothetical protein